MTITIKNKKVKVREMCPKKDKIRKTDIWDLPGQLGNKYVKATEFPDEIGKVYQGVTPCYRPIKPTRKPSAKRAGVKVAPTKAWAMAVRIKNKEHIDLNTIASLRSKAIYHGGYAVNQRVVRVLITPLGGGKENK